MNKFEHYSFYGEFYSIVKFYFYIFFKKSPVFQEIFNRNIFFLGDIPSASVPKS